MQLTNDQAQRLIGRQTIQIEVLISQVQDLQEQNRQLQAQVESLNKEAEKAQE